jgi:hypothetical protein
MSNHQKNESVLAIIGGGRWGRVTTAVAAGLESPFDRIVVVSSHNTEAIKELFNKLEPNTQTKLDLVTSLDFLHANYKVQAAIVVNAGRDHFTTSVSLIERGINVLIEKPIVLEIDDATALLNLAAINKVYVVPGLCYRFCSYIDNFIVRIKELNMQPKSFSLQWSDSNNEVRYNEQKTSDTTIDVAQDVMPHVWTILSKIFRQDEIQIDDCLAKRSTDYAAFSVRMAHVQGMVSIERGATQRNRLLTVHLDEDHELILDFTAEPGKIVYQGNTDSADEEWDNKPRPLQQQLGYFFAKLDSTQTTEADMQACLNSVKFTAEASKLLHATLVDHCSVF